MRFAVNTIASGKRRNRMPVRAFVWTIAACASFCALPAAAQSYPTKPVKLVVPFPPGGSTDIIARALGQKLSEAWGQQVIIDNRGGAGGVIGATAVAKAAPDGYTLLMGHIGTLAVNATLYTKLPYDPTKDFAPVSLVAVVPNVLVVNSALPVKTVQELVAYAKANPGMLNYSSGGNGSAAHIASEYFKLKTHTNIVHVAYKGTAPSVTDLIGGQVALTMTGAPAVLPHVRSGRLRALAVTSPQRLQTLPAVPTVAESGFPGFDATQWYGVVAPAKTPGDIVAKINADIRKIMQSDEMRARLADEGAYASTDTPEQFAKHIRQEIARWGVVVKSSGMQSE